MDTQHVEFAGEDTTMTDDDTTPTPTPAARAIPFVRPEFPIVIKTITRGEGNAILRHVINNDTARLSRLLEDLAARDRTIPGKILVQAQDAFGRNAIHVALRRTRRPWVRTLPSLPRTLAIPTHTPIVHTLAPVYALFAPFPQPPPPSPNRDTPSNTTPTEMLIFLLHNSILPVVYPRLKRTLLNQVTLPAHGGDNPPLDACRLAKSIEVVRKLMAAGGALLGGARNELGLDGLQCVVGPTVYGVMDVRESGNPGAGARLVRALVEGGMFRVGRGVVYGQWAGDREV